MMDSTSIVDLCKTILPSTNIKAIAVCGPHACGCASKNDPLDLLVVAEAFPAGVRFRKLKTGSLNVAFLAVSRPLFELDVSRALLGETVTVRVLMPYKPLSGFGYLREMEVKFKRRRVLEALTDLAVEYPETTTELMIHPKYFPLRDVKLLSMTYPPLKGVFSRILKSDRGLEAMVSGYVEALKEVESKGLVEFVGEAVRPTKKLVSGVSARLRSPSFVRLFDRAFKTLVVRGFTGEVSLMDLATEIMKGFTHLSPTDQDAVEDPNKYLILPTGRMPTVEEEVRRVVEEGVSIPTSLRGIGGILNAVYMANVRTDGVKHVVVKRFQDWYGFKWFPVALWTSGVRSFALRGSSRLDREYSMTMLLRKYGIPVPDVIHVDLERKALVKEYIDGEPLPVYIKEFFKGSDNPSRSFVSQAAEIIAKAHSINVTLGDCKPDNFVVSRDRRVFFVDLEQASRGGERAWDVAEFLYFSCHHAPPTTPLERVSEFVRVFADSYLGHGGDLKVLRKAAGVRFLRPFTVLALPHFLVAVSRTCLEVCGRG